MSFSIEMGLPEMDNLWKDLMKKAEGDSLEKDERQLLKKLQHTIALLAQNPRHPGLGSHDIEALTKRYDTKVWQSCIENNKPSAGRLYWVYGPEKGVITI